MQDFLPRTFNDMQLKLHVGRVVSRATDTGNFGLSPDDSTEVMKLAMEHPIVVLGSIRGRMDSSTPTVQYLSVLLLDDCVNGANSSFHDALAKDTETQKVLVKLAVRRGDNQSILSVTRAARKLVLDFSRMFHGSPKHSALTELAADFERQTGKHLVRSVLLEKRHIQIIPPRKEDIRWITPIRRVGRPMRGRGGGTLPLQYPPSDDDDPRPSDASPASPPTHVESAAGPPIPASGRDSAAGLLHHEGDPVESPVESPVTFADKSLVPNTTSEPMGGEEGDPDGTVEPDPASPPIPNTNPPLEVEVPATASPVLCVSTETADVVSRLSGGGYEEDEVGDADDRRRRRNTRDDDFHEPMHTAALIVADSTPLTADDALAGDDDGDCDGDGGADERGKLEDVGAADAAGADEDSSAKSRKSHKKGKGRK